MESKWLMYSDGQTYIMVAMYRPKTLNSMLGLRRIDGHRLEQGGIVYTEDGEQVGLTRSVDA